MSEIVRKRRGFTLGEVLVTVAIVSVLAAVVIPAITSQISKGDLGRVGGDLQALRSSAEQFVGDVRRYPKSLGQLVVKPTVSETPLASASVYGAQEVARWRGPYLPKDSIALGVTGYGLKIGTGVADYKFDTMTVGTTGVFSPASPVVGDILYLVIPIASADQTTAQSIDGAIDDGNLTTGSVRWKAKADGSNSAGAADTLKFLVMPIIK